MIERAGIPVPGIKNSPRGEFELENYITAYSAVSAANRRWLERLKRLSRKLDERGIECLLLKGADLVTRVYPALGVRAIGDVDLLIHEKDLDAVEAVAAELGLKHKIDGNATFVDPNGDFPIDVSTSIWYLDDDGGVWRRAVKRRLFGLEALAMEATDALFFACAWSSLHRAYFTDAFAEDARLLIQSEAIDWPRFRGQAESLGLRAPLRHALSFALARRGVLVPSWVMEELSPRSAWERAQAFLLCRLVTRERLLGLSHALMYLTMPRGRRWKALRDAFLPGRRFLLYRYGKRSSGAALALRLVRPFYLAGQSLLLAVRLLARLAGLSHGLAR